MTDSADPAAPPPLQSGEAFLAGRASHVAGDLDAAERHYRQAIEIDAGNADAIHLLGVLHAQRAQYAQAERLIRQALAIKEVWAYHDNLSKSLRAQGMRAEARAACLRAVELKPDHAEGLNTAAILSLELGDRAQAESIFRRILERWPDQSVIHNNLGNLCHETRRIREAEAAFRQAIALAPDYAIAHYNLGNLLNGEMRREEAIQAYRHAVRCEPAHFEALNNLGNLYLDLKQYPEAESAYLNALTIQPGRVEIMTNLGNLYAEQKRYPEAARYYRQALALNPNLGHERVLLSYCKRQMCDWQAIDALNEGILNLLERNTDDVLEPLQLFSEPGVVAIDLLRVGGKKIVKDFGDLLNAPPLVSSDTCRDKPKLRIGYLSADFHAHATMHLLLGVLEQRDTAHFETFLYSCGPDVEDDYRRRARKACERFTDLRLLSDKAAAEVIAHDAIDILVDLKGYTTDSRLGISAWRPAPVIVSWLGYPGTLGHPRLADYILGDPIVTPLRDADHFSEMLALMPHSYQPTDAQRSIGPRPSRREAGLPETGFVFCSFNQSFKINPETFSVWCELLDAVPGSLLWLIEHTPVANQNLRREAKLRGIDPDRLVFAGWASQTEHLGRLQWADLALDTFPYGSHTTGSDALWAGVPLISRSGETFASRVSASLLHAVGLPELVTGNWADYRDLAYRYATYPDELARLKVRLQALRTTAPLFDTARFTRNIERMYRLLWQQPPHGVRAPVVLDA